MLVTHHTHSHGPGGLSGMTTLPDPNDAAIVQKVMDRHFQARRTAGLRRRAAPGALRGTRPPGHGDDRQYGVQLHRRVGQHPRPRGAPDRGQGWDAPVVNGHQRPDSQGTFQGFGGEPGAGSTPVLGGHTAADSVSTSRLADSSRFAGPKYRAKLIARTETMYAQNESLPWRRMRPVTPSSRARSLTTRRASVTPTARPVTALWGRWTNVAVT